MRGRSSFLLLFALAGSLGCRAEQLASDQDQFRGRLLDLYTNQIMDNLVRTDQGLPIVQLDFSKITGTITQNGMATFTNTQTTVNTKVLVIPTVVRTLTHAFTNAAAFSPSAYQTSVLTVTADPVLNNNEVYNAYLEFVDPDKKPNRLMKTHDEPPPDAVLCGLTRRCGDLYYWIPAEFKADFLRLALVTTVMRGQPLTFPDKFDNSVAATALEFSKDGHHRLAIQFNKKMKNGTGTLTADINGETQDFPLSMYVDPGTTPPSPAAAAGTRRLCQVRTPIGSVSPLIKLWSRAT